MGQSLFCSKCGLEVPLDCVSTLHACSACGNMIFVPARLIPWDVALSENDRKFLKSIRVKADE